MICIYVSSINLPFTYVNGSMTHYKLYEERYWISSSIVFSIIRIPKFVWIVQITDIYICVCVCVRWLLLV